MAEQRRLGAGTRAVLGLPPENPVDIERHRRQYLIGERRKLDEIAARFSESAMPEWWRAFRVKDDEIGKRVVMTWGAARRLRGWLRARYPHPGYLRHRKVLDSLLADLSVMLTSTGVLAPKKREQLTAARAVAADTNRRRGIENGMTVRTKAAELKAQREKRGEKPLSYPQLCNSIARVLGLSAKTVKSHYPKSLHT